MCGFIQSSLVTVPFKLTALLASNSAANEWCANTGSAAPSKPKAARSIPSFTFIFNASKLNSVETAVRGSEGQRHKDRPAPSSLETGFSADTHCALDVPFPKQISQLRPPLPL